MMNIKILIFTIILFIFCSLFYFFNYLKKIYRKKVVDLKFWRNKYQNYHNEYIEFLSEAIPYLEKWNVKYWAHAGTLLGCVRHGGFIPWDDDIDFGYIDDGNIEDLITDLKNNGFGINYKICGIKIDFGFGFQIHNYKYKCIDMFTFTHKNNMLLPTKHMINIYPNEYYYYDEVIPLKKCKFNKIYLSIPNDPDSFCKRAFKDDYMDVFYINIPHPLNWIINPIDSIFICSLSKEKFNMKDLIE